MTVVAVSGAAGRMGQLVAVAVLVTLAAVDSGTLWQRTRDSILLWFE